MIAIFSPHEIALSKAAQRRLWATFMEHGTSHSANASTLPYVMRRCEQEGISYTLKASPGTGYWIERGVE